MHVLSWTRSCLAAVLAVSFNLIALGGCTAPAATAVRPIAPAAALSQAEMGPGPGTAEPAEAVPRRESITLIATGDILMHNTLIWSGAQQDGSYRFASFFEPVKRLLGAGDYVSTDLEAALAGPESGYTGYPLFNSPDAIARDLKEAGYGLVVTANNHALDRGPQGAMRTLDVLRSAGLDTLGAYKSAEEARTFLIKEIRGVRVGYLAYTYGTNGIAVPQGQPYLVNLLDPAKVKTDIAALRPQVDVLVLVLHWGVEYSPLASEEQKRLARDFLSAGADVILGSHPHVLEPMEVLNIGGRNKFVIYSLGNFIGDQHGVERNTGVVLRLSFTKDFTTGTTMLQEVSYIPTYSHSYRENGRQKFRVVPVEATIAAIKAHTEPHLTETDLPVLEQILASARDSLGEGFRAPAEGSPSLPLHTLE